MSVPLSTPNWKIIKDREILGVEVEGIINLIEVQSKRDNTAQQSQQLTRLEAIFTDIQNQVKESNNIQLRQLQIIFINALTRLNTFLHATHQRRLRTAVRSIVL